MGLQIDAYPQQYFKLAYKFVTGDLDFSVTNIQACVYSYTDLACMSLLLNGTINFPVDFWTTIARISLD